MITYYQLPLLVQMLFMTLQFIAVCMGISLLPTIYKKRNWLPKLLLPLGILISGGLLVIYSSNVRYEKMGNPLPAVTAWLSQQPVLLPALVLSVILAGMVYAILEDYRYRKSIITSASIKEGFDCVDSGLCFFRPTGRVILVNRRMNALCHVLTGSDLQNALRLWEQLQSGVVMNGAERLTEGNSPSFRLADGTVWTFACEELKGVYQLTAVDTTQLHVLTETIASENRQLEAFNQRLRNYGENVDQLTRSRERLEIKINVHRTLGQALLATRRFLQEDDASAVDALELWNRSIMVLHKEAQQQEERPLESLKKVAAATGIHLEIKGELPAAKNIYELFIHAAAESLTNALTHAKAKTLYLEFEADLGYDRLTIYNDGLLPEGPVTEGGGLTSLRVHTEKQGGSMRVVVKPQFLLTITVGRGLAKDV